MFQGQHGNCIRISAPIGLVMCGATFSGILAISFFFSSIAMLTSSQSSSIKDNPHFQDDRFNDSRGESIQQKAANRTKEIVLMVLAVLMISITIGLCMLLRRKANQVSSRQPSTVLHGQQPLPVVSGYHTQATTITTTYPTGPQPMPGYNPPPQQGYPPQQQGYPPRQQQGYPPPQQGYPPPQQGYPPPQQGYPPPPQGYPPPQQGYPSQQQSGYSPPAQAMGYPLQGGSACPPPSYSTSGTAPSAPPPPPSYSDVTGSTEKSGLR